MTLTLYHNARCQKSRAALAILEARSVPFRVVEYLKAPPDAATLDELIGGFAGDPAELVRTSDSSFNALAVDPASLDAAAVRDLLLAHPEVMQRPLAVADGRTLIGRPPELIEGLLG